MLREVLITALHKHAGRRITPEVALAIVADLCREEAVDIAQFAPEAFDGVTFQAESFRAIRSELHQQHLAHWAETERYRARSVMAPDYDHMADAEREGRLIQFTVRHGRELVGNLRVYLYRDLHTQELGATEDTLYLAPAARRGFVASRFIAYVERCLAQVGVVDAYVDAKVLHDEQGNVIRDIGVLLRRAHWSHVANRFHKRLNKE